MDFVFIVGLLIFAVLGHFYVTAKTAADAEAKKKEDLNHPADKVIRSRYNFEVRPSQEKNIKIEKLYIYPMRGIMGIEVDSMKVSKFGIKYDREWAIYDGEKLGCVTQSPEVKLTQLRQRIEKDQATKQKYLVISIIESHQHLAPADLPKELRIPIRKEVTGEVVDTGKVKGVREGEQFDQWFSKFLGKPVVFLRSAPGFKKGLPMDILKWGVEEDLTKGFVSKAAIHLVNEASTRDLSKRVLAQYSDPAERARINITSIAFRPNIIVDSKFAYEEDRIQEARVANVFLRLVGFCSRCKAVANNYDTNDRNPELEPNPTIAKFRKHELGTLFGTYHQVEVIGSQEQYRRLMPDFQVPRDRKFDEIYGIIKVGDDIKVRINEQRIEFDPNYQAK
jgi:uncharacterized protein YcbX